MKKRLLTFSLIFLWADFGGVRVLADELKLMNIRVEPMSLMFGIPGLGIDVGINSRFSVGPRYQRFSDEQRFRGFAVNEYSIVSYYYLSDDRFHDSWVFSPALRYFTTNSQNYRRNTELHDDGTYLTVTGGYEWDFQNGLNTFCGIGLSWGVSAVARREVDPLLAWELGYAF